MTVIAQFPHILARAVDEICLLLPVVGHRASCPTDVRVRGKDTERTVRAGARPFHVVGCPPRVAREREKPGEVGWSTRLPFLLIALRADDELRRAIRAPGDAHLHRILKLDSTRAGNSPTRPKT